MDTRKQWDDMFNVLRRKNGQPRILYSAKLSFESEGRIKTFPDKPMQKVHCKLTHLTKNTKGSFLV